MVGPVINVGPAQSSRYALPNYAPLMQGWALANQGIRDIFGGIKEFTDRRNTATLTEMMTAKADHDELVDFAGKRGLLPQLQEMLTTRKALAPPPMPEMFETVRDPYGRGGAGQRSSKTGRIVGYQGPAASKDDKGFTLGPGQLRHDAAGNVIARGPDAPSTDRPPIKNVLSLSNAWQKATAPLRSIMRQRDLMQIGLERAAAGDMAAGSQAVLVTFQKILDPTSVVRESEYARSASGLSLLDQAKGQYEKLKQGGAGMTLEQLGSFARFADEAVAKLAEGRVGKERARIKRFADAYGIDPTLIFEGKLGAPPPPAQAADGGRPGEDARTEAVMQSLGLTPPGFDPQTRPPAAPAQASGLDPRFMGDAGLVTGGRPPPPRPGPAPQTRPPPGAVPNFAGMSGLDLQNVDVNSLVGPALDAYIAAAEAAQGR